MFTDDLTSVVPSGFTLVFAEKKSFFLKFFQF